MTDPISRRKDEHLALCLREEMTSEARTGLGRFTLEYDALPELDLDEVDLSVTALGKRLAAPLMVGAMTGGSERAAELNARLAQGAARVGVAMAAGSQRAMLVSPELTSSFCLRAFAPTLPLVFGNIGAVQLNLGLTAQALAQAVLDIEADALNLHLNPLQEAIQPGGDTCFKGLFNRLADVLPKLPFPCLIKEVGAGISERAAFKLAALPVAGLETAGTGGTSWAKVESHRAQVASPSAIIGRRLAGFGTPTADAIRFCRAALGPERLVVASGGIRTGMDVAVALALGADLVAVARPLLNAAAHSVEAVEGALALLIHELKVICFCCGAPNVAALRQVRLLPADP